MKTHKDLFIIRDKLGDTLIAFQCLMAYANHHPERNITVVVRGDYQPFCQSQKNVTTIKYRNWGLFLFRLINWRLKGTKYNRLIVLRGFGSKIPVIGHLVSAKEKYYLDDRFMDVFPLSPERSDLQPDHMENSFRMINMISPNIPKPDKLFNQIHAEQRKLNPHPYVFLCPVSDEKRRTLSEPDIVRLYNWICKTHPDKKCAVLVRQMSDLSNSIKTTNINIIEFSTVIGLISNFYQCHSCYTIDTGCLHIAESMEVPTTVIFGPTQTSIVIPPGQNNVTAIRLKCLGSLHCENKACVTPVCMSLAINKFVNDTALPASMAIPENCLITKSLEGNTNELEITKFPIQKK